MAVDIDQVFRERGGQPRLLQRAVDEAVDAFAEHLARARDLVHRRQAAAAAELETQFAQATADVQHIIDDVHGLFASPPQETAERVCTAATAPFNDPFWKTFAPVANSTTLVIPRLVRVGDLSDSPSVGQDELRTFSVPALVPFLGDRSLIFAGKGPLLDRAREALGGFILRHLAGLPAGRMRLTLVDHPNKGRAFSSLLQLHKTILGDMVWHEPRDIDEALKGLIEHMSVVIQKNLTNQYADIEAYNAAAGDMAQPYRVLAIADFPSGFDKNSAERVLSIARNGRSVGVYVVMTLDRLVPPPHGFTMSELERVCTVLKTDGEAFRFVHEVLGKARVELDRPPSSNVVDPVVKALSGQAEKAEHVKIPFRRFLPEVFWRESTEAGIDVPLGRRGARDDQKLQLGRPSGSTHHALVGGRTGMGKSVLLHSLITGLTTRYSPAELELYLIDFKEGVEFEPYRRLPHARVVAIESEREFGLSVLEGLRDELNRRGELFKRTGVNTLGDYRAKAGTPLPRVLAIIDEFQVFFDRNDRLAGNARALLDDVARRGRSFGLHLVLCTQTLASGSEQDLEATTLAQLGLRIALALNEADSHKILSRDNDAARHLERPGEAIYNDKAGHVGGNSRFQVAYLSSDELKEILDRLQDEARSQGFDREPLVFEGNRSARIESNREIGEIAAARPTSIPRAIPLFLGEPASIQPRHTSFRLRRQNRSNLIILGQTEHELLSVFLSATASFALGLPSRRAEMHLLNLINVDDPIYDVFDVVREFDQQVKPGGRRDVVRAIDTVAEIVKQRLARLDQGQGSDESLVLLGIFGLQRARDLQRELTDPLTFSI